MRPFGTLRSVRLPYAAALAGGVVEAQTGQSQTGLVAAAPR